VKQHQISPAPGSRRDRKRVGRGNASGHGTYSGRGLKGQKARAGGKMRPGFEGGQLPLIKRLPRKRGFTNIFKTEFNLVNVEDLSLFDPNTEVTIDSLVQSKIIKSDKKPVKVLARGELDRPLTVTANKFTRAARQKIESAGGRVEEVAFGSGPVKT
jgi:large subunit ribosomal protein L15